MEIIKKNLLEVIFATTILFFVIIIVIQIGIGKKSDSIKAYTESQIPELQESIAKQEKENQVITEEYKAAKYEEDKTAKVLSDLQSKLTTVESDIQSVQAETAELKKKLKIEIGISSVDMKGKDYKDLQTDLKNRGFINVRTEGMGDMIIGLLVSEGEVENVSISGESKFKADDKFPANSEIVIEYHSYKW